MLAKADVRSMGGWAIPAFHQMVWEMVWVRVACEGGNRPGSRDKPSPPIAGELGLSLVCSTPGCRRPNTQEWRSGLFVVLLSHGASYLGPVC